MKSDKSFIYGSVEEVFLAQIVSSFNLKVKSLEKYRRIFLFTRATV